MNLQVINTGSKGNCYILGNEEESLIIEAGVNIKDIMKAIDFKINKVAGCLVSHEHNDHAAAVGELTKKGIDVFASSGTLKALNVKSHRAKSIGVEATYKAGNFIFRAYKVKHDAAEPVCFEIFHSSVGKIVFVTDTNICNYTFQGVNHFIIEANYDEKLLFNSKHKGELFLKRRIAKNHFSIQDAVRFLNKHNKDIIKNVILIHLSDNNSHEIDFGGYVLDIGLYSLIADKGKVFNLLENSQLPF